MNKRVLYISLAIEMVILIFILNINIFLDRNINSSNITNNYNEYLEEEYNALLEASNINASSEFNLILTKVKYRSIYEFNDTITIYKGFSDGLEVGMSVLDEYGLVGVITRTYQNESVVRLITSPSSNISVAVGSSYGILKSVDGTMVISDINNYEEVSVSDTITTSGLGELPAGIYIGVTKDITLNATQIEKIITVDIAADLDNLNYLFVRSNND